MSGEDTKLHSKRVEKIKSATFWFLRHHNLWFLFNDFPNWRLNNLTTLERSGEDVKLHSKGVGKMWKYTRNEWERCENYTRNEWRTHRSGIRFRHWSKSFDLIDQEFVKISSISLFTGNAPCNCIFSTRFECSFIRFYTRFEFGLDGFYTRFECGSG